MMWGFFLLIFIGLLRNPCFYSSCIVYRKMILAYCWKFFKIYFLIIHRSRRVISISFHSLSFLPFFCILVLPFLSFLQLLFCILVLTFFGFLHILIFCNLLLIFSLSLHLPQNYFDQINYPCMTDQSFLYTYWFMFIH